MRPIEPNAVLCKDGRMFSVRRGGRGIILDADFRDPAVVSSGLGRFTVFHEPGDGSAEHGGMPVEIVRAYARAHGGVAEAGEQALSLLKELAGETPITDSRAPISEDADPDVDFLGRPLPPPHLRLDCLTDAVIEARRGLAEVHGPLVLGLGHADASPRRAALERRVEIASLSASRLSLVDRPRYAAHPLREEAVKLRKRLAEVQRQALAEIAREA